MSKQRGIDCLVLREDNQHSTFMRAVLKELGFDGWRLRDVPRQAGKGAGEQFVRMTLAETLDSHRRRSTKVRTLLFVLIDADTETISERRRELEAAIAARGLKPIGPEEGAAILIPKRNIETWLAYLEGESVDEITIYPKSGTTIACSRQAKRFVEHLRSKQAGEPLPIDSPPSLVEALEQLALIL